MLRAVQDSSALWLTLWGVLGLIWGSFINVLVHRLPRMMETEWRQDARVILGLPPEEGDSAKFNLVLPRSTCPNCGHLITVFENIPVLSYIWLRGKCGSCKAAISCRYPLLEILCALGAVYCAHLFGFGWQAAAAAVLTWALLALAVIDAQHSILPDSITLPVLWLGLLVNSFSLFVPLHDAVAGAMIGYMAPWLLYHVYRLVSGKEGMGYGDFKLIALFGAWLGWSKLPMVLLFGASIGLAFAIIRAAFGLYRGKGSGLNDPMPFGPSLVLAGWSVFVFDISFSPSTGIGW